MSLKRQKLHIKDGLVQTQRKNITRFRFTLAGLVSLSLLAAACSGQEAPAAETLTIDLPNPASQYCLDRGYQHEIQTAEDGSQSGWCIFPDNSNCDEWAFFRGECGPSAQADQTTTLSPSDDLNSRPTPNSEDYQGWWTFIHPVYNFSLLLPEDWVVQEITSSDTPPGGQLINLHPRYTITAENIRIAFRPTGDERLIWPTGVGQGEFVQQGSLEISGEPADRYLLVCPTGETTAIWYHQAEGSPAIMRGEIDFAIIFLASPTHCEPGFTVNEKVQRIGELIISSLNIP